MRIAFVANPALGHVLPLLPLATAARDAGHDVVVVAGSSVARAVEAAGLRHVTSPSPDLPSVFERVPERAGLTGRRLSLATWTYAFAGLLATELAGVVLELARDWRPDLVIHEDSEQGSWIAAERLGVPHVALQVTAWRSTTRRASAAPLNRLMALHDLPPDPDLHRLHRNGFLTTRPPALQNTSDPTPPTTRPLRPDAADETLATAPPWVDRRAGTRVAVTMGTMPAASQAVLPWIGEAFAGLDAEVVVALGPATDPDLIGTPPANVRLVPYVPMSRLLPTCDALVFHVGSGTMLAAVAAGVPLVMLPVGADQFENAERCEAAGVGLVLGPDRHDPASVRAALEAVLHDPRYRSAAEAVRGEILAMPSPQAVLPRLESLAAAGADAVLEPW